MHQIFTSLPLDCRCLPSASAFPMAATFLFPKTEGPAFSKGTYVNIAFQSLGFVIAIGLTLWYRYENARRDKAEGGRPPKTERIDISEHYDRSVGFRYVA